MKFNRFIRLCAMIISTVFTCNTIAQSAPDWMQRVAIDQNYGQVSERWMPAAQKMIVLVQDAHDNVAAQENIAGILTALMVALPNNSQPQDILFGIEGSSKKVNMQSLRALPFADERARASQTLLHEGYITGAEYAAVTAPQKLDMRGVEDRALFIKDYHYFYAVQKQREKIRIWIADIEERLNSLKQTVWNKKLHAFDTLMRFESYQDTQKTDYFMKMLQQADENGIDLYQYPQSMVVREIMQLGTQCDQTALRDEIARALTVPVCASIGCTIDQAIADARIVQRIDAALRMNGSHENYPQIERYVALKRKEALLDITALLTEVRHIARIIADRLAVTPDEKKLLAIQNTIDDCANSLLLSSTRADITRITGGNEESLADALERQLEGLVHSVNALQSLEVKPVPSLPQDIYEQVAGFYHIAEEREKAMVANLCRMMDDANKQYGVLVVGGYHTEGIKEILREKHIAYLVVTPHVNVQNVSNGYMDRMLGQLVPVAPHLTSYLHPTFTGMDQETQRALVDMAVCGSNHFTAILTELSASYSDAFKVISDAYYTNYAANILEDPRMIERIRLLKDRVSNAEIKTFLTNIITLADNDLIPLLKERAERIAIQDIDAAQDFDKTLRENVAAGVAKLAGSLPKELRANQPASQQEEKPVTEKAGRSRSKLFSFLLAGCMAGLMSISTFLGVSHAAEYAVTDKGELQVTITNTKDRIYHIAGNVYGKLGDKHSGSELWEQITKANKIDARKIKVGQTFIIPEPTEGNGLKSALIDNARDNYETFKAQIQHQREKKEKPVVLETREDGKPILAPSQVDILQKQGYTVTTHDENAPLSFSDTGTPYVMQGGVGFDGKPLLSLQQREALAKEGVIVNYEIDKVQRPLGTSVSAEGAVDEYGNPLLSQRMIEVFKKNGYDIQYPESNHSNATQESGEEKIHIQGGQAATPEVSVRGESLPTPSVAHHRSDIRVTQVAYELLSWFCVGCLVGTIAWVLGLIRNWIKDAWRAHKKTPQNKNVSKNSAEIPVLNEDATAPVEIGYEERVQTVLTVITQLADRAKTFDELVERVASLDKDYGDILMDEPAVDSAIQEAYDTVKNKEKALSHVRHGVNRNDVLILAQWIQTELFPSLDNGNQIIAEALLMSAIEQYDRPLLKELLNVITQGMTIQVEGKTVDARSYCSDVIQWNVDLSPIEVERLLRDYLKGKKEMLTVSSTPAVAEKTDTEAADMKGALPIHRELWDLGKAVNESERVMVEERERALLIEEIKRVIAHAAQSARHVRALQGVIKQLDEQYGDLMEDLDIQEAISEAVKQINNNAGKEPKTITHYGETPPSFSAQKNRNPSGRLRARKLRDVGGKTIVGCLLMIAVAGGWGVPLHATESRSEEEIPYMTEEEVFYETRMNFIDLKSMNLSSEIRAPFVAGIKEPRIDVQAIVPLLKASRVKSFQFAQPTDIVVSVPGASHEYRGGIKALLCDALMLEEKDRAVLDNMITVQGHTIRVHIGEHHLDAAKIALEIQYYIMQEIKRHVQDAVRFLASHKGKQMHPRVTELAAYVQDSKLRTMLLSQNVGSIHKALNALEGMIQQWEAEQCALLARTALQTMLKGKKLQERGSMFWYTENWRAREFAIELQRFGIEETNVLLILEELKSIQTTKVKTLHFAKAELLLKSVIKKYESILRKKGKGVKWQHGIVVCSTDSSKVLFEDSLTSRVRSEVMKVMTLNKHERAVLESIFEGIPYIESTYRQNEAMRATGHLGVLRSVSAARGMMQLVGKTGAIGELAQFYNACAGKTNLTTTEKRLFPVVKALIGEEVLSAWTGANVDHLAKLIEERTIRSKVYNEKIGYLYLFKLWCQVQDLSLPKDIPEEYAVVVAYNGGFQGLKSAVRAYTENKTEQWFAQVGGKHESETYLCHYVQFKYFLKGDQDQQLRTFMDVLVERRVERMINLFKKDMGDSLNKKDLIALARVMAVRTEDFVAFDPAIFNPGKIDLRFSMMVGTEALFKWMQAVVFSSGYNDNVWKEKLFEFAKKMAPSTHQELFNNLVHKHATSIGASDERAAIIQYALTSVDHRKEVFATLRPFFDLENENVWNASAVSMLPERLRWKLLFSVIDILLKLEVHVSDEALGLGAEELKFIEKIMKGTIKGTAVVPCAQESVEVIRDNIRNDKQVFSGYQHLKKRLKNSTNQGKKKISGLYDNDGVNRGYGFLFAGSIGFGGLQGRARAHQLATQTRKGGVRWMIGVVVGLLQRILTRRHSERKPSKQLSIEGALQRRPGSSIRDITPVIARRVIEGTGIDINVVVESDKNRGVFSQIIKQALDDIRQSDFRLLQEFVFNGGVFVVVDDAFAFDHTRDKRIMLGTADLNAALKNQEGYTHLKDTIILQGLWMENMSGQRMITAGIDAAQEGLKEIVRTGAAEDAVVVASNGVVNYITDATHQTAIYNALSALFLEWRYQVYAAGIQAVNGDEAERAVRDLFDAAFESMKTTMSDEQFVEIWNRLNELADCDQARFWDKVIAPMFGVMMKLDAVQSMEAVLYQSAYKGIAKEVAISDTTKDNFFFTNISLIQKIQTVQAAGVKPRLCVAYGEEMKRNRQYLRSLEQLLNTFETIGCDVTIVDGFDEADMIIAFKGEQVPSEVNHKVFCFDRTLQMFMKELIYFSIFMRVVLEDSLKNDGRFNINFSRYPVWCGDVQTGFSLSERLASYIDDTVFALMNARIVERAA